MIKGFLLGLSTSVYCLSACLPVVVPLMMKRGEGIKSGAFFISLFLLGRFIAYLAVSCIVAAAGKYTNEVFTANHSLVRGSVYIAIALILGGGFIMEQIRGKKGRCGCGVLHRAGTVKIASIFSPILIGFLLGMNLCPPFIALILEGITQNGTWNTLLLFIGFFIGTTLAFIPLPFISLLNSIRHVKQIAVFVPLILSIFYLFSGFLLLTGGFSL